MYCDTRTRILPDQTWKITNTIRTTTATAIRDIAIIRKKYSTTTQW